ncbi:MAG TPA: SRPBCC family protein [Dongiaceae bacterium]|nr:SRPBCC family protein [Dongiaceae bacterium]
MTVKIKTTIKRSKQVNTQIDALYELLTKPQDAGRFFPRVEKITALGNDSYYWVMEPMGTQKYQHRVEYASQWEFDAMQKTVRWRALPDKGNASISGVWQLEPTNGGTKIALEIRAELLLDLPRWMQIVAEPIVQTEFQKLLNSYFDNVVAFCPTQALAVN